VYDIDLAGDETFLSESPHRGTVLVRHFRPPRLLSLVSCRGRYGRTRGHRIGRIMHLTPHATWVVLRRSSDEVVLVRVRGRRGSRRQAQLREDVAHMAGDRLLADEQ